MKRGWRVLAAVFVVWVVWAGLVGDDGGEDVAERPSKSATKKTAPTDEKSPSRSPSPTPTVASSPTEPPAPQSSWEKLVGEGDPDDLLHPDDVDELPKRYFVQPSRTGYEWDDDEYEPVVRRDVAAYALELAARSRSAAKFFDADLSMVPAAWCSVVAPSRTWSQFRADAVATEAGGRLMADLLGVPHEPLLTDQDWRLVRFAVGLAARRFCPDRLPSAREPSAAGNATGAGNFPDRDHYRVSLLSQDGYDIWQEVSGPDGLAEGEVILTFQSVLVGGGGKAAVLLECGDLDYLSPGDWGARDTAENLLEIHNRFPMTVADRQYDVWEHQRNAYEFSEQLRACKGESEFGRAAFAYKN